MPDTVRIRRMTSRDVDFGMELCALSGWNQTPADWRRLLGLQPDGCFIAEWDGKPAGTVTTTCYASDLAWIGMMLVHPAQRRQGIGRALMWEALEHLREKQVRCIKLDATPAGQSLYEKLGFIGEWTLTRWVKLRMGKLKPVPARRVRRGFWIDHGILRELDRHAFGANRFLFFRLLENEGCWPTMGISPAGRLNSFGFCRRGALAHYFGPIVGTSFPAAAPVIKTLLGALEGQAVFWDIPDHQTGVSELARTLGFEPVRQLTRMYLGGNSCPGDPRMIFGIAGPEVG